MTIPSLFITRSKEASLSLDRIKNKVEGPVESWPEQIVTALFSEHPYLSEYLPEVEDIRSDGEEGYMLGYIHLGPSDETDVKIPVIVRDREILPFATFINDDDIFPLTEERIYSATMTQAASDSVPMSDPETEEMLRAQDMDPPDHASHYGNRYVSTKLSSIRTDDLKAMEKAASRSAPRTLELIRRLMKMQTKGTKGDARGHILNRDDPALLDTETTKADPELLEVTAEAKREHDTYLVEPVGVGRYRVSSTSASMRKVATEEIGRRDFRRLPQSVQKQANEEGYSVLSTSAPSLEEDVSSDADIIETPGEYMVQANTGETLIGSVLPRIVDLSGIVLPMKIFYDGDRISAQEQIAGKRTGDLPPAPTLLKPEGVCTLCYLDPETGELTSTVPFSVHGEVSTNYGPGWRAETYLGDRAHIVRCDSRKAYEIEDGVFMIPAYYELKQLSKTDTRIELTSFPAAFDAVFKAASMEALRVIGDGTGSYSLRGPGIKEDFLDRKMAHFKLAAYGVDDPGRVIKKADYVRTVRFYGEIPHDQFDQRVRDKSRLNKQASEFARRWKGDPDVLVKVAESMIHFMAKTGKLRPESIDAVLSLGFVNPENTSNYAEAEPELETTQKILAGLVVASQMGYSEIPMSDTIKAMQNIEEVLEGLRKLKVQKR